MLLIDVYKIPILLSLGVVACILAVSIGASIAMTRRRGKLSNIRS